MTTLRAAAIVTGSLLALLHGAAGAQTSPSGRTPSQRDFDACNREAELTGGYASPGASSTIVPPTRGGLGATNPATSAAGATGNTGSLSGGSTLANGTASGMRPGSTDPGYQQAYRECMRRLGYGE